MSVASISLDLDNKWSYMKTHGDRDWNLFPSYLDIVVPRVLDILEEFDLKITFFVVGQDAALEYNHSALKMIADAGHEISNHSFHHNPWLHLYDYSEIEKEILSAHEAITNVVGKEPIGFRGPGYSFSKSTFEVLKKYNYLYDASTLPTFIGPLARFYYFLKSSMSKQEKQVRMKLFGSISDGFRSLKPYFWQLDDGELFEIPVTTMPILKLPFHISYIIYLNSISPLLAQSYFKIAISLCRLTRTQPSILLHPLDFLGCDDLDDLAFFPGMNLRSDAKIQIVKNSFTVLTKNYRILTMQDHAELLMSTQNPRIVHQNI